MKLSHDDLLALQQIALSAATEAGSLIAQSARRSVEVLHKTGGDSLASQVLTEVDLAAEAIILKWLLPSCEQYDLALLTEETADDRSRLEKDYFWCVDPMDGTLSFIEATPGFAVAIALVTVDGLPILGVVYDPVSNHLYTAMQGQGVRLNDQLWQPVVNESVQGKPLTLVCDRDFLQRSYYPQIYRALEHVCCSLDMTEVKIIDKRAGAIMNACWVLEQQPACYFKLPKPQAGGGSLWDFAATVAMFHELKAVATDFHGAPLQLNRPESSFLNHCGVMFSSHSILADAVRDQVVKQVGIYHA